MWQVNKWSVYSKHVPAQREVSRKKKKQRGGGGVGFPPLSLSLSLFSSLFFS